MLPGNPALVRAGPLATPEYIAEMAQKMGLDQPLVRAVLAAMSAACCMAISAQSSSTGRPVLEDFLQRLPATLELTLASLLHRAGRSACRSACFRRCTATAAIDHVGRVVEVGWRRHADLLDRACSRSMSSSF